MVMLLVTIIAVLVVRVIVTRIVHSNTSAFILKTSLFQHPLV